jgi:D-alanyl-D-alanine carboxypeptidase
MPALGTVEALTPIAATPPNLREEMCGKHRRRPAAEEADDTDEPAQANGDTGTAVQAFMLSNLKGSMPKPSSLIGPLVETMPPIPVFLGPAKTATHTTIAATPAGPGIDAARQAARKPVAAALVPSLAARTSTPVVLGAKPMPMPVAKPKPAVTPATASKPAVTPAATNKPAAAPTAAKPATQQANIKPATTPDKATTAAKPAAAAKPVAAATPPAAQQPKVKPQPDKKAVPAAAQQAKATAPAPADKPKPAAP